MLGSDDYKNKLSAIEKKQRRIAQFRTDINRYNKDRDEIEPVVKRHNGLDLNTIEDLNKINDAIKEADKINVLLKQDITELEAMAKGFVKRRGKLADAELRAISKKRKDELGEIDNEF